MVVRHRVLDAAREFRVSGRGRGVRGAWVGRPREGPCPRVVPSASGPSTGPGERRPCARPPSRACRAPHPAGPRGAAPSRAGGGRPAPETEHSSAPSPGPPSSSRSTAPFGPSRTLSLHPLRAGPPNPSLPGTPAPAGRTAWKGPGDSTSAAATTGRRRCPARGRGPGGACRGRGATLGGAGRWGDADAPGRSPGRRRSPAARRRSGGPPGPGAASRALARAS